ncbi:MAG TPA: GFA family protein [Geminicoccaceae bacterium]|nr:GFA family protein [Geminicoccaceae bacterium]
MPLRLEGSCRCQAVRFAIDSHTPQPYQRCYCSICRKTAGGGGYAINLMGVAATLEVTGRDAVAVYHAEIEEEGPDGACRLQVSPAERQFCRRCASALWLFDPRWPELVHPFASAIDGDLPVPPARVHLMLRYKPGWVEPAIGPDDQCFDEYPEQSIEDWHKSRGLWVE